MIPVPRGESMSESKAQRKARHAAILEQLNAPGGKARGMDAGRGKANRLHSLDLANHAPLFMCPVPIALRGYESQMARVVQTIPNKYSKHKKCGWDLLEKRLRVCSQKNCLG